MPLALLLLVALGAGAIVTVAVWRYPSSAFVPTRPTAAATEAVGHTLAHHSRLRRLLVTRLDPEVATGLALTLALGVIVLGGLVLAVLAYLVRSSARLVELDESAAQWGFDHASDLSDDGLKLVTTLGETWFVIAAAILLVVVDLARGRPTRWEAGYLAVVIVGQSVLTRTIKELADRVRPDLNPIAETLGPSFPSGHSAAAAAFYAAAALVLGRGRPRLTRAMLAGGAVAITVAVAGSRVLLDVHWLSDVIAGVALGWAWFAACSVAFGGRILRFGAAAERAGEQAVAEARSPRGSEAS
ncbi:MAG TPA: phosphatase PAP2 family protein [Gaiella sp.]|jgi:undecaprenyl-diphosphatase|nr:phosphatase PAP2 family protein [Gaiella sp.]